MTSADYSVGGSLVAVTTGWGAVLYQWMAGMGFFHPTTFIAIGGTFIGFVANWPKLKTGAAALWADIASVRKHIRGKS